MKCYIQYGAQKFIIFAPKNVKIIRYNSLPFISNASQLSQINFFSKLIRLGCYKLAILIIFQKHQYQNGHQKFTKYAL